MLYKHSREGCKNSAYKWQQVDKVHQREEVRRGSDGVTPFDLPILWQEQENPHAHRGEVVEHSSTSSTSRLIVPSSGTRHMSLEVDSLSEASSGSGRRSFIGLSDTELLKCAFSYPQTEGAPESPWRNSKHH